MTLRDRYRDLVLRATRRTFPLWERIGVHVTPVHFYQPVPDTRTLDDGLWERPSDLPGVDLDEPGQLALLDRIIGLRHEYGAFPTAPTGDPRRFHLGNGHFDAVDAEVLWAIIRLFTPRKIVEVGSGFSTLLAAEAVRANADAGAPCELVAIDPYPKEVLRGGVPGLTGLIESRVEDVAIETFTALGPGDILFLDSSHVLRTGGDVQREYLEIIPRLAPGVLVHVHDVFLPAEYPRHWLLEWRWFWTEQYLLQAFLAFNPEFQVLWAGNHLRLRHADRLAAAFPSFTATTTPGSFWMRRRPAA